MKLGKGELVVRYSMFAGIATCVNLITQFGASYFFIFPPFFSFDLSFYTALFLGTLTGLVIKYILDRKWIFYDSEEGITAHSRKFSLYTVTGGFTTIIFWGTEIGFDFLFQTEYMRYVGGALGLCVGYLIKYQLDKRQVFKQDNNCAS
jgi:hypothetical protein